MALVDSLVDSHVDSHVDSLVDSLAVSEIVCLCKPCGRISTACLLLYAAPFDAEGILLR